MVKKYNGFDNFTIKIPNHVSFIINTLVVNGFEAYAVGGCIRDTILGREPEDWDITTSALPMQIKGLFRRTVDTGIKHGTVTVLIDNEAYEVTTYRIDGEYEDFRHPKSVEFTTNLIEDLKRRDFTINAMAYNVYEGLVDAFGGIHDLENKMIRCVGEPKERFSEDALRTLRAIRFSAQLDFTIEKQTYEAICKFSSSIVNISMERIQVELDKMLLSDNPDKIRTVYDTGITSYIMPEFDLMMKTSQNSKYHKYSVGEHTIAVLMNIRKDHYLRWAALLHDIGKPFTKKTDENGFDHFHGHGIMGVDIAKRILQNLRFDNKTINLVLKLIEYHDYKVEQSEIYVRKSISRIGKDCFPYYLELCFADLSGKSDLAIKENLEGLEYINTVYKKTMENQYPTTIKELEIDGNDLIEMGILPGKSIGIILHNLLTLVLEDPEKNSKKFLMDFVKKNLI